MPTDGLRELWQCCAGPEGQIFGPVFPPRTDRGAVAVLRAPHHDRSTGVFSSSCGGFDLMPLRGDGIGCE